jgi:hypothetical protein
MDTMVPADSSVLIFLVVVAGFGTMLLLFCCGAWRIDHDAKETKKDREFFQKSATVGEPQYLDPGLQTEYAKSWLEGRYMGEEL